MKRPALLITLTLILIQYASAQNKLTVDLYDDNSDGKLLLQFNAAKESHFSNIEFQYSTDSLKFETIESTAYSKDSNSTAQLSCIHHIEYFGKIYYRVITDSKISATASYEVKDVFGPVKTFPNPAANKATILFNNRFSYECSVKVFSVNGFEVMNLRNFTGNKIDISAADLKPGLYRFFIQSNNDKTYFEGSIMIAH